MTCLNFHLSWAHIQSLIKSLATPQSPPIELRKPYVATARSKGLSEARLIMKYPVRIALNPFISTAGWSLPTLFSGSLIVATVMSLPTIGPLLLNSLMAQDMFMAGSILLILTTLTVIGTLISDLLLAWIDPRIRMGA